MKESRKARRAYLECVLLFSAEDFEGEARVVELSKTGCQAESDTCLAHGLELRIELKLPDHPWLLKFEQTTVRWAHESSFGLDFRPM